MAEQQRKPKPKKDEEEAPQASKTDEDVSNEMDELLDEIDEVLEANAEDFVRSYVQKGGQ